MSQERFLSSPVLIFSPKKAGSSLLHNLLDGGSELLMLPGELKLSPFIREAPASQLALRYLQEGRLDFPSLLQFSEGSNPTIQLRPEYHFEGLSKEQTQNLFDLELYVRKLQEMLERKPLSYDLVVKQDVSAFTAALRSNSDSYKYWAAKEIAGDAATAVPFFQQHFPQGRMIYLVRNLDFIVRSIILDRRRKGIELGLKGVWRAYLKVQEATNYIFHHGFDRENAVVVAYEDLTHNTEKEMRRLAEYLEIAFDPILCSPTTLGVPVIVRTSSQSTKAVFQQASDWKEDLSATQVAGMRMFHLLGKTLYRRQGRRLVEYREIRSRLRRLKTD